jgi:lipopolysaccharide/colanic/teichoic acid biosynthesis glycosyltransferase
VIRKVRSSAVSYSSQSNPPFLVKASRIARSPTKRAFDYAGALLALSLTLPLMMIVAITIKVIDPGPALFVQEREGHKGRKFRLLKFRSMFVDADAHLDRYLEAHPERRSEWERYFKLDEDPRLLPYIGAFLRRTSLDELPNLLNVLTGKLSMVGPRPLPPYHLRVYEEGLLTIRRLVRPGVTGLWQLYRGDVTAQANLDITYIANWSLWLDLKILARTLPAVLLAHKPHY